MGDVTLAGDEGRPRPVDAHSAADFVAALRRLKNWSGLGYRELEKRARSLGEVLPRSTLTAARARDSLPREDLVVAFVRTCGAGEDELRQWVSIRRRIAAAEPDAITPDAAEPEGAAEAPIRASVAPATPARPVVIAVRVLVAAVAVAVAAAAVLVAALIAGHDPRTVETSPAIPVFGACDQDSRHWIGTYLGTGSGPATRYVEVVRTPTGESGRSGTYHVLTGEFVPETTWMDVQSSRWYRDWVYEDGSLARYYTVGYASLLSGYGPTVWATQLSPAQNATAFTPGAPVARWGLWNLVTNRFYPSSPWTATDNAPCRISASPAARTR